MRAPISLYYSLYSKLYTSRHVASLEVKAYRSSEVSMVDLGAPLTILLRLTLEGEGTTILQKAGKNLPNEKV